jgi:hypothetical protein
MLEEILKKASMKDVLIIVLSSLGIVGFWRGVWNIMDKFLFPNNFILSQTLSIIIGVTILIIMSKHQ